jgi:hypothetical protein
MPRVRTRGSSVTATAADGSAVNVSTEWTEVSDEVAAAIAHLVEVEPSPDAPMASAMGNKSETVLVSSEPATDPEPVEVPTRRRGRKE